MLMFFPPQDGDESEIGERGVSFTITPEMSKKNFIPVRSTCQADRKREVSLERWHIYLTSR